MGDAAHEWHDTLPVDQASSRKSTAVLMDVHVHY